MEFELFGMDLSYGQEMEIIFMLLIVSLKIYLNANLMGNFLLIEVNLNKQ